jgi:outer membrane protein OmpA-like peptidoglycan-associated protein
VRTSSEEGTTTADDRDATTATTTPYFGTDPSTTSTTGTTGTTDGRSTTSSVAPGTPVADPAAPPEEATATFDGGTVVLRGSVPDEATAAGYVRRLRAAFGDDAVTSELALDDRTTAETVRIEVAQPFASPGDGTFDPAFASLAETATTVLAALPEASLAITGHTDAVSTEATDRALSVARARLVVEHLVDRGVPADRMTAEGVGRSQPVAADDTPAGRAANRRITAAFVGVAPVDG